MNPHWNYRVMRHEHMHDDGEISRWLMIHAVNYRQNGKVGGWTDRPESPRGDTLDELKADLERLQHALTLPILDAETGREVDPAPGTGDGA